MNLKQRREWELCGCTHCWESAKRNCFGIAASFIQYFFRAFNKTYCYGEINLLFLSANLSLFGEALGTCQYLAFLKHLLLNIAVPPHFVQVLSWAKSIERNPRNRRVFKEKNTPLFRVSLSYPNWHACKTDTSWKLLLWSPFEVNGDN